MTLEPVSDPFEPVDAAVGAAEEDEQVRLLRVAHHLDGPAEPAQRGEDELGLLGWAAHVPLGLEQEERGLVALDPGRRRAVGQALAAITEAWSAGRDLGD